MSKNNITNHITLKNFLDADFVVKVFGERESGLYASEYAAGSYHHTDAPYGYLIKKQYSNSDDVSLFIYQNGEDDIKKDFTTIDNLIVYLHLFVRSELRNIKINEIIE